MTLTDADAQTNADAQLNTATQSTADGTRYLGTPRTRAPC